MLKIYSTMLHNSLIYIYEGYLTTHSRDTLRILTMRRYSLVIFCCLFVGIQSLIPEALKKDFFNIHKGLAVEIKNITGSQVTIDKVNFTLFNKITGDDGILINTTYNLELIKPTDKKVVFILHGWNSAGTADWVLNMKNAFLHKYPNSSVIVVDWQKFASQLYSISSINTYDIGNFVADIIINLTTNYHIDLKKVLLVGHSLGGQSCGFAGKKLKKVGKKLPRIIALDPAGPLFDVRPESKRLNRDDAEVVEIIHSDRGRFGFNGRCGTLDFFPNGGKNQPGCTRIDLLDIFSVAEPVVCNHQRSYEYFTEAILNPQDFVSTYCTISGFFRKCDENIKVNMGDLSTTLTGTFYLETNRQPPYAKKLAGGGLLDILSINFKQ